MIGARPLLAARPAGLTTIVSPTFYTADESFQGVALVLPDLSRFDPPAFALESSAGRN